MISDLAGFTLLVCLMLLVLRDQFRRAKFRLVFVATGAHAGRIALVWFRPSLRSAGGRWRRLWLPPWLSRRLWLARACGSGRLARWLRRFNQ